jgi:hypothetical protein
MVANVCEPVLQISDGTTTVDLLHTFRLNSWLPALPEPKGGGIWQDNPLAHSRRMVFRKYGNIIDTFDLKLPGIGQDDIIHQLQDLRELLENAVYFWTTEWSVNPVYIAARGSEETNIRYAIIHDWRTPQDNNPFAQPFFSKRPLVNDFILAVEHGLWMDVPPGLSTVLELSAIGSADVFEGLERYAGQSGDDGSVDHDLYISGGNAYEMGVNDSTGGPISGVFRFPNVTIPQGASIRKAYLSLQARLNTPNTAQFSIRYQRTSNAATFSTYANFISRSFREVSPRWTWPYWVTGTRYQTSDIKESIQEIVDLAGWSSGNGMAFQISPSGLWSNLQNRYYNDWDRANALGLTGDIEPVLIVTWDAGDSLFGQERTDEPTVFVANKHNFAQLSNIYRYDASGPSWSGNLIGETTPFDLFPATPAAGDILYIGSVTGIFNSVVFDLGTVQVDITTAVWEYSLGADAWDTLTTVDLTAIGTLRLAAEGVNSVGWRVPADWATDTVNAVDAYWIRLRITAVGAAPASPEQDNRNIYTVITPYVDIDADDVGGDVPALIKISMINKSDNSAGGQFLFTSRVIAALRSLDRGIDFSPFINLSDTQTQTGITLTDGTGVADGDSYISPTGRSKVHTCTGNAVWETALTITLDNSLAYSYLGRFHAFLRGYATTGARDNLQVALVVQVGSGSSTTFVSQIGKPASIFSQSGLIDLGSFVIPNPLESTTPDSMAEIQFAIIVYSETLAGTFHMQDLILMPTDECIVDTYSADATTTAASSSTSCRDGYPLTIDSISNLKGTVRANIQDGSGRHVANWMVNSPNELIVNTKKDQRLWFLASNMIGGGVNAPVWIFSAIQIEKVQRYLGMRGSN